MYSDSAQLISFEISLISKEINRAEPEYMNMHTRRPIHTQDPPLLHNSTCMKQLILTIFTLTDLNSLTKADEASLIITIMNICV